MHTSAYSHLMFVLSGEGKKLSYLETVKDN